MPERGVGHDARRNRIDVVEHTDHIANTIRLVPEWQRPSVRQIVQRAMQCLGQLDEGVQCGLHRPCLVAPGLVHMDAGRVQHSALGRVGGKWLLYYLRDDHLGRPEVETNQANQHVWLGGEPVALVRNGRVYQLHNDHLGRPHIATNAARQVVWKAANLPFDRHVQHDAIGGLNLGFPGQYFDAETGFWHNGFRDYDSRNGTYLQSDPIALAG